MRSVLLVTAALAMASPAAAAPSGFARDAEAMAERLNDPAMQSAMTGMLGAFLSAFLDMRVDGIAKALEPLNGGRKLKMKGNTIREMAERKDPRFEEKIEGGTQAAVAGMGAMASALAAAAPQLEEAMEKMGDAMEKAKDRLPRDDIR